MKKVDGSVTSYSDDVTSEDSLFTYSEVDRFQSQVNKEMAEAIWRPEFIPFYTQIQSDYKLTDNETKLYGLIRHCLVNLPNGRFHMTTARISLALNCSEHTASEAVSNLRKKKLIEFSYRTIPELGTRRWATAIHIPKGRNEIGGLPKNRPTPPGLKLPNDKDSNINESNISLTRNIHASRVLPFLISPTSKAKKGGVPMIPYILDLWKFWKTQEFGQSGKLLDKNPRFPAHNIFVMLKKRLIGDDNINFVVFLFFWWLGMARESQFKDAEYMAWALRQVPEFMADYPELRDWNSWDVTRRSAWANKYSGGATFWQNQIIGEGIVPQTMILK